MNISSGPVDEIFEKLNNDFGENCEDNMRPLPLIQYGWEDFYILFLDE